MPGEIVPFPTPEPKPSIEAQLLAVYEAASPGQRELLLRLGEDLASRGAEASLIEVLREHERQLEVEIRVLTARLEEVRSAIASYLAYLAR